MLNDVSVFALTVFAGAAAVIGAVYFTDRWLTAPDRDKPMLKKPLRVRKIKARFKPAAPRRTVVYPDGREKVKQADGN